MKNEKYMKKLIIFESFVEHIQENEKKKEDMQYLYKAIKNPKIVNKLLGLSDDEDVQKMPATIFDDKINELHKKEEKGELSKKESEILRKLIIVSDHSMNIFGDYFRRTKRGKNQMKKMKNKYK